MTSVDIPAWIAAIMEANGGGWFVPFAVGPDHPLVLEEWRCMYCQGLFAPGDVAAVMPFTDDASLQWVAVHGPCVLREFGVAGRLEPAPPSITCPRCELTSYHSKDIAEGYCGRCHDWTSPRPGST